ncbi:hypothetical protein ACQEVS_33225 [Streptomyces sp. CA-181903]|uniref:hypothetical protein n=1 Tax=Streptomyces sp. CA-181903 TaxID=3240055 RepID=UPI003D8E32A5
MAGVTAAVGVADHLVGGPRTPAEPAQVTETHAAALYRVLRLFATRGLFEEDAEGRFRLAEAGGRCIRTRPCPYGRRC